LGTSPSARSVIPASASAGASPGGSKQGRRNDAAPNVATRATFEKVERQRNQWQIAAMNPPPDVGDPRVRAQLRRHHHAALTRNAQATRYGTRIYQTSVNVL